MSYRLRDILLAAIALLLLAPLMAVIALLLCMLQGQVWFVQERPGLHERPFRLIKFAKMDRAGQYFTPAGAWLQRWSLDELPQLWNVLRGDMSLVGPRPLLMEYLPLYNEAERLRHSVPPGITGWAQLHGRSALPFKARFQLDLWYVQHRSFALDARILCLTLLKVLRREGNTLNMERWKGD